MKKKNIFLMMQAVVLLCCSLVMSSCDAILATEDNPVTSYLQISDKAVTLKVGDTYTRTAFAASDAIIEYSSSDVAVATVDQSGLVTAVGAGTALITVRATGYCTDGRKIYIEDSKSYEVKVTGGGAAPSTNSYRVYTSGTAYTDESIPAGAIAVETSAAAVTWPAGTYVVEGNKTITGNITLTGDVNLILCDGTELIVNGMIDGQVNNASMKIYGQAASTGKLTINDGGGLFDINVNNLEIHGGDISATNADQAIETQGVLKIYHGKATATGPYNGFEALGNFNIYGGTVIATATRPTRMGIECGGTLTIDDGTVTAIGGNGVDGNEDGGSAISCPTIIINGGTINATGGNAYGAGTGGNGIDGSTGSISITGGNVTAIATGTKGVGINSNTIGIDGSSTIVNSTGAKEGMYAGTSITFKAGTVSCISTDNNSDAIESPAIDYYGGTITGEGGPSGGLGFDGILTNKSGATVTIGRKTNSGDAWTGVDVADAAIAAPAAFARYMILPKP